MSWGNAPWGTQAWGGGAPVTQAAVPISLTANTLHAVDHVVAAQTAIMLVAGTLHAVDHVVAAQPAITLVAGTLHESAHIVVAVYVVSAATLHETVHIVSANVTANVVASSLHIRAHLAPVPLSAVSLHIRANAVPITGITPGAAIIPIAVLLNGVGSPHNPQYVATAGATPQFYAALLDSDLNSVGPVPSFAGASATFSMHELGGAQLFENAAVFDDVVSGRVHYQVRADELSVQGKFLARFHVAYAEGGLNQAFPDDRFIEIIVQ